MTEHFPLKYSIQTQLQVLASRSNPREQIGRFHQSGVTAAPSTHTSVQAK